MTQVTRFLCLYDSEEAHDSEGVSFSGDAKGVRAVTDGVAVFLTGGEMAYGRGQWLRRAWAYNSLTDRWAVLRDADGAEVEVESPRRHHSACLLDQKVSSGSKEGLRGPCKFTKCTIFFLK